MYYYNIGDTGLCFDTCAVLEKATPFYERFSVSREKYELCRTRIVYSVYEAELPDLSGVKAMYNTESEALFIRGDETVTLYRRFDTERYRCCLIEKHGETSRRIIYEKGTLKYLKTVRELFCIARLPSALLDGDSVILHSSYILYNGCAVLFSGNSGCGKSTQAELWRENANAVIVNGDRAVLCADGDIITVHSLPLCGSSGVCLNVSAPLKAIVFLSHCTDNSLRLADSFERVSGLIGNLSFEHRDKYNFDRMMKLAERLSSFAGIYCFDCLPDVSAFELLKGELFTEDSER